MVNIITDSCADLSPELIQRFNIPVIRLNVFIDNQTYKDGANITIQQLFEKVDSNGQLPKTSAPSVAEFIDLFSRTPGDLIFCGISSKLSATLQSAILAAEALPDRKIYTIDSLNLSTGIGLLALFGAELRDQGRTAEEIAAAMQAAVGRVHTSFIIDTLDYLYMGGRCSAMDNVIGSLLKIRPIIEVRPDGTLGVKEKTRGTRKKAFGSMLADFQAHLSQVDLHRVFVTHTGCDADAAFLKEELLKIASIEEVCITQAGATVASHCGPDTIGILYLTK